MAWTRPIRGMEMIRLLGLVFALVLVTACGTTMPRRLDLVASNEQQVFYRDGISCSTTEFALDNNSDPQIGLGICGVPLSASRGRIDVWLQNNADRPVTLADTDVSIELDGIPLEMLRYDDLLAEEKSRQNWQAFAAGLAAGANAYSASQAGQSTTTGYATGSYSGYSQSTGRFSGTASGSYRSTTNDGNAAYWAQRQAQADNAEMFSRVRSEAQARTEEIEQVIFRTTTVDPGSGAGGGLLFELPPKTKAGTGQVVVAIVVVEGRRHTFELRVGD